MNTELKIGDFIKGKYRYGCVFGIVTEIKKSNVVIKRCKQWYNEYTITDELLNVTKSRINRIGLDENEIIKI